MSLQQLLSIKLSVSKVFLIYTLSNFKIINILSKKLSLLKEILIIPNDLSVPTVVAIFLFWFYHHVSVKEMETSIETLLVADTLLSTVSREDDSCMVFPHPPSLPQPSPAPAPPSSMSPHSIAQSTMSELSQLDYDLMYQDSQAPARYHHTYQELESSCNSHWREHPSYTPPAVHQSCQTRY